MKTSVGCEGCVLSPGLVWKKFLKAAADFHASSSSLPSMTGGFSKRVMRTGRAFSGASASAPCKVGVAAVFGAASVFAGAAGFFAASVFAPSRFAVLTFAFASFAGGSFLAIAVRSCARAALAQRMMQRMMMIFISAPGSRYDDVELDSDFK